MRVVRAGEDACATAALLEKRANADILEIVKAEWDVGTSKKAFQINLDPKRYGTFAEIGAGQEVVRWFFRVGGAAGTIAKSMSAYDMAVSDAIYGQCDRYVCRQRLEAMEDHPVAYRPGQQWSKRRNRKHHAR